MFSELGNEYDEKQSELSLPISAQKFLFHEMRENCNCSRATMAKSGNKYMSVGFHRHFSIFQTQFLNSRISRQFIEVYIVARRSLFEESTGRFSENCFPLFQSFPLK